MHSTSNNRAPTRYTIKTPLQNKKKQRSQYPTFLRGTELRGCAITLCGELFLTWLTLNEASDEKKMLFSPRSWARSGYAMGCLMVCVHCKKKSV